MCFVFSVVSSSDDITSIHHVVNNFICQLLLLKKKPSEEGTSNLETSALDCSQSPIFPYDRRCRCGFLNGNETGKGKNARG